MFIDKVGINVKAGRGGNGCNSFYKPRGSKYKHPNGGSGGKGGDVYIVCDPNLATLLDFYYKKNFSAPSGKHGGSNKKLGKNGKSIYIKVPPGTIVKNATSGNVIKDICSSHDKVLVAKGGEGGKGNAFRSIAEPGKRGEELELELELKLIADVGLVGLPNAGKSTFLVSITNAKSKIASYPFTTKSPVLGSLKIDNFDFIIADIPGLIEGAHKGRGLGDEFLRHVERTKLLIFMIDVSVSSLYSPFESYQQLIKELKLFKQNLIYKPRVIALNKIDQVDNRFDISKFAKLTKEELIYPISSITGEGVDKLITQIERLLKSEEIRNEKAR